MTVEPLTAREALFAIVGAAKQNNLGAAIKDVQELAETGLHAQGMVNFELTDQLADRLAEAHKLLADLRDSGMLDPDTLAEGGDPDGLTLGRKLVGRVGEVLALPPDLEAMVERRIGHS